MSALSLSQSTTYSDSPPSSPNPCIDSSPPSSPGSEPADSFVFKEPYAASHKLTRKLRTYGLEEREPRRAKSLDDDSRRSKRRRIEEWSDDETGLYADEMEMDTARDYEEDVWEEATSRVLEEACGRVDLRCIPSLLYPSPSNSMSSAPKVCSQYQYRPWTACSTFSYLQFMKSTSMLPQLSSPPDNASSLGHLPKFLAFLARKFSSF